VNFSYQTYNRTPDILMIGRGLLHRLEDYGSSKTRKEETAVKCEAFYLRWVA